MSELSIAVIQCAIGEDREANIAKVTQFVRDAAGRGAQVVLPPELFEGPYFPRLEDDRFFELAAPIREHPTVEHFRQLAAELEVVIPISVFERAGQAHYNSVVVAGQDGDLLGVYRKSHIPDGPGYQEKYYFRPGDSGFKVWPTPFGTIGVGICWDQWFPEVARAMVLMGADVLLYPTAIGSEPAAPDLDTRDAWQRVMQGHSVANVVPIGAANRIGTEGDQTFYGSSFITGSLGEKKSELGRDEEGVLVERFDLTELRRERASWGFFRDRRPDLYQVLTTADGQSDG